MADRGLTIRIPIWVRVPGIIALVLVGVLVSAMLLGAADIEGRGDHGSGGQMEMDGAAATPAASPPPSGHGSGDETETDGGGHEPTAAPSSASPSTGDETEMDGSSHGRSGDEAETDGGGHGSGDEAETDGGDHGSGDEAE